MTLGHLLRALQPPLRDPAPAGPPPLTPRLLLGLAGAWLAALMALLNSRLVSFGLADLRGALGVDTIDGTWLSVAYSMGEIAVVPLTPWLAGIFTGRRAIVAATLTLTGAGLVCSTQPGYQVLLVSRFLQGLGGGALIPLLLMSLLRFLPLHQRAWGFAAYACVTVLTPTIAETLDGWYTEALTWKAIFWQNLLLAPPACFLVLVGLPTEPVRLEAFRRGDYFALGTSAVGLAALVAALLQGQNLDWFDSGTINGLFLLAGVMLAAFVVHELRRPNPVIDLRLLRKPNFTLDLVLILGFNIALLGPAYVLPQYAVQVQGYREAQIGTILIWLALPQMLLAPLAALLLRVIDARLVLAFGFALFVTGAGLTLRMTGEWVGADLLPGLVIQGCAFPFVMTPLVFIATSSLQMQDAPSGGALFNIVRSLAGSLASAVVGAVITVRERVHDAVLLEHLGGGALAGTPAAEIAARARNQAFVLACTDAYGLIGLAGLAALLVVLLIRETPRFPRPGAARSPA
ncbi:DHA2 family efflux MFS transporter permease subunit [Paracraurococcus lichenis]|uniref:DHA2 family efflux MFS transporter permease subunit n=1 Tax=Paracraurococcus lichenis TaxID=3064888 RepID=A0ABT9E327_9PROT|nr:DHA2 family efflux MFS transporter permease subunit [Paracraurococcus sp. LOR1-02]MDO9710563.1 DHA2 family efflux MFS transporter permease subunit [Paracraurococcus sp. LOR1-02]